MVIKENMKFKKIKIDGFRCFNNFELEFEDSLTLIIGENDSGKTSLLDCLDIFRNKYKIDEEDFREGENEITIELFTEDFQFIKNVKRDGEEGIIDAPLSLFPTQIYIEKLKAYLESEINLEDQYVKDKLAKEGRLLGCRIAINTNYSNLKNTIFEKLGNPSECKIERTNFPPINLLKLDGKQFEDVKSFLQEIFSSEKEPLILEEKINKDQTLGDVISEKIYEYSKKFSEEVNKGELIEKLKKYLTNLNKIKIDLFPQFSLNSKVEVSFLEGDKEINIRKKGDGTKRRITLALLEHLCQEGKPHFYILDEPDTHLHVKAQLNLFGSLNDLCSQDCQIILTTHSPFLINKARPKQIRLLCQTEEGTKLRYLREDSDSSDKILRRLGIENIYLYFARKILLVEGETEEAFIPKFYFNLFDNNLNHDLIKIINVRGIPNIPGFSRAMLELMDKDQIFVMMDNDASPEINRLIQELDLNESNKLIIGTKEFEDSFKEEIIHKCWEEYHKAHAKSVGENWTLEKIKAEKEKSLKGEIKFSKTLRSLNKNGKKMTKPIFGEVLGEFCSKEESPTELLEFITKLKNN